MIIHKNNEGKIMKIEGNFITYRKAWQDLIVDI
jgi:hypothetical protein